MQRIKLLSFLLLLVAMVQLQAQTGSISGIVIDASNAETLVGATVLLQEVSGVGASSDIDGQYRIDDLNPGTYTVVISYVSFETKTIPGVEVTAGNITRVDVSLSTAIENIFGDSLVLTIKGTRRQENLTTMLTFQKNNIAPAEVMSRDIITRTPDRNTGEVLRRMSGTTITDGRFVVIRGLSDRYNIALVNGNILPSTEPDRKTFAFDMFPSSMLDNLIVIKAAQPNLPGDFAGGIILLNTRDIPEENFLTLSVGGGYNSISTFQEYYAYQGGSKDWLGVDDGSRQLPSSVPGSQDLFDELTVEQKANIGKDFAPWGTTAYGSTPIDQNYQLSGGLVKKIGKVGQIGAIGAVTYSNSNVNSIINRLDFDNLTDSLLDYTDQQYRNNVNWGALLNLSYKLNGNNKVFVKNSYNVTSSDITTLRTGYKYQSAQYVQNEYYDFSSNQLTSSQIGGEHFIPVNEMKLKWTAGVNKLIRDQPNFRTVNYAKNYFPAFDGDTVFNMSPSPFASPENLGIFYSYMEENTKSVSADITYPFKIGDAQQSLGIGGLYLGKNRSFDARVMGVAASNDIFFNPDYLSIVSTPIDQLLIDDNFSESLFFIDEITNPSDAYTATQTNKAVYAMLDNKIGTNLRIVWGARAEFFAQTLSSFAYGASTTPDPVEVDTKETDSVGLPYDLLPSVNITYAVSPKSNIRVSAYKTVARPELRELAPFGFYDIETNSSITGNPGLLATNIYNADLKFEHFPGAGQALSGGVFYKRFYDPIGSRFIFGTVRELKPINDSVATVLGAEIELRKNLGFIAPQVKWLEHFTFNTNLALLSSETVLNTADTAIAGASLRDLQGQSDYVINVGLTYIEPDKGYSFTLLYNQIGRRISEYGNAQYYDIYENPRPLLDAQIAVPFAKNNGTIRLNVSDLLSQDAIFYQDINADGKYVESDDNTIRQIEFGTRVSLTINYTIK